VKYPFPTALENLSLYFQRTKKRNQLARGAAISGEGRLDGLKKEVLSEFFEMIGCAFAKEKRLQAMPAFANSLIRQFSSLTSSNFLDSKSLARLIIISAAALKLMRQGPFSAESTVAASALSDFLAALIQLIIKESNCTTIHHYNTGLELGSSSVDVDMDGRESEIEDIPTGEWINEIKSNGSLRKLIPCLRIAARWLLSEARENIYINHPIFWQDWVNLLNRIAENGLIVKFDQYREFPLFTCEIDEAESGMSEVLEISVLLTLFPVSPLIISFQHSDFFYFCVGISN